MTVNTERFQGALLGLALGEAMGLPHAGSEPGKLGRPTDLPPPPGRLPRGQYGPGSQTAFEVVRSVLDGEGFDGEDVAERLTDLYREGRIVGKGEADREAVNRLLTGSADWTTSGAPMGRVSMAPALRAVPLGLYFGDDPDRIREAATVLARVTHKDPRVAAAAVGSAAAVAYLVRVDQVDPEGFTRHLATVVRPVDGATAEALEKLGQWAGHREDLTALAEAAAALGKGTPRPDSGEGVQGAPVFISALIAFLRSNGDFLAAMGTALKAGGETDLTAGLAGALVGSYAGTGGIPRHLADLVTDRGAHGREEILELGARLHALTAGA